VWLHRRCVLRNKKLALPALASASTAAGDAIAQHRARTAAAVAVLPLHSWRAGTLSRSLTEQTPVHCC
jgi:hypothetical protein